MTRGRGQSIILVTYRVGLCGDPISGIQALTRQNWESSNRSEAMFHTGCPGRAKFDRIQTNKVVLGLTDPWYFPEG